MKKIILSLVLISFLFLPVLADAISLPNAISEPPGPIEMDPLVALKKVVNWLFAILLTFAAIFIIIAGFTFVTASGNPESLKKARDMVIYAVIGIIVALLSRGIVNFVEKTMFRQ